jgi:pimeloyl-ACP methyl ester carboxylesterase
LLRGMVLLALLGVIVPLALLPVVTSIPARIALGAIAGVFVLAILAVAASQKLASTPVITDAEGRPLPNSIAVLEQVKLGGSKQWISIRGKDVHHPVLLFLAGGPGGSELPVTRTWLGALEDQFVIVNWDQPGCGKSYRAVPLDTLTPERYIEDAHELVHLLRMRFQQDKIYLMGESWGSMLGIMLVQQYPDLFYVYIGAGQMVNTTENDVMGYEFALTYATERGDTKTVEALRRNGPPPYVGGDMLLKRYQPYLGVLNRLQRT